MHLLKILERELLKQFFKIFAFVALVEDDRV